MLVAVQVSVPGSYLPPVSKRLVKSAPPQTIISLPVHTPCEPAGSRRVSGAGGCPAIGAGIVPPAGVQIGSAAGNPTPDDHFTARPHCCVTGSGTGRVGGAGGCPCILNASIRASRYVGKRIATTHRCDWLPLLVFRVRSPGVQRFLIIVVDFS